MPIYAKVFESTLNYSMCNSSYYNYLGVQYFFLNKSFPMVDFQYFSQVTA